jgi:DNA recombination protein RmuC
MYLQICVGAALVEMFFIFILFYFLMKNKAHANGYYAQLQYLKNENDSLNLEIKSLREIEKECIVLKEKLNSIQNQNDYAKEVFENVANLILEKNIQKSEKEISKILKPVENEIEDFKRKIEEMFIAETKTFGELFNELKNLKTLNESLSKEAQNLANALKNQSKTQGTWGEIILERVLELSGLRKGIEYKREVSIKDYRPDVVIYLPENKKIIIDAKTSLKDYIEYMNTGDEKYLKKHIESVKNHIKRLSVKDYEKLVESEFVFMFIPVDNALNVVLQKEPYIYEEAFKNKIILISPTTLLPVLRVVESIWRYERQNQNIKEVVSLVDMLYKQLRIFIEEYEKLGKNINISKEMYDKSTNRLIQNVLPKIKEIKEKSGIKPKKEIKEII